MVGRNWPARRKAQEQRFIACCVATVLVFGAHSGLAAEREHAAHVHGFGQLNIAVEGEAVEMELIAPGADIVGFEHTPESDADKAAVTAAASALRDGASLFAFPQEAGCRMEEAGIESGLLERGSADKHEHDDKHEHGVKHGDDEHDEAHAEFHAHYRFHCERPDRLTHVDVKYFERFPAAEELEVQTISARGQSAQELTASSVRLKF